MFSEHMPMTIGRFSRVVSLLIFALCFGNLSLSAALANDLSHPSPMGLWVENGFWGTEILSTNYESNTVTDLIIDESNTATSRRVLTTGLGPIDVLVDDFGNLYTSNYLDNSLTQFIYDLNGNIESHTVATGNRPISISSLWANDSTTILSSNVDDNSISQIIFSSDTSQPIVSNTIQSESTPMALNTLGEWNSYHHQFRAYWLNYESNTLQYWNPALDCAPCMGLPLDNSVLPWDTVDNGALVDETGTLVNSIHPIGLKAFAGPGVDVAYILFEGSPSGQPSQQYLWAISLGVGEPIYLGKFDTPLSSLTTNQRIAVDPVSGQVYLLSSDGGTNAIVTMEFDPMSGQYAVPHVIWTDAGLVAIAADLNGYLYAANSVENSVEKFDASGTLLANFSMNPTPRPPAAPSFTLSSSLETATVGSPIAGFTIDSSAGGAIDIYDITPEINNGLTFDPSTGLISGTPTSAASAVTYTITGINVTDTATATFTLSVNPAPTPPTPPTSSYVAIARVQRSKITGISVSTPTVGKPTLVKISGDFIEKIQNIEIADSSDQKYSSRLASGSWTQTATEITFSIPSDTVGNFQVNLYNGSAPALPSQKFLVVEAKATSQIVDTTTSSMDTLSKTQAKKPALVNNQTVKKIVSIRCVRGKLTKIVKAVKPKCPKGYIKR